MKKISLDHKTFGIGVNKYEDMLCKEVEKKRPPLCEKWRYDKKAWFKEVDKLDKYIRYLKELKKWNDFRGCNDSKEIKNQIDEYHKSLDEAQKMFLSVCERKEEEIRKSKLLEEQKENELSKIVLKTSHLILGAQKYYTKKIKIIKQIGDINSCINNYKRKIIHGLYHLDLDKKTFKDYLNKYKEMCNNQTQNNLFKKSKIEK